MRALPQLLLVSFAMVLGCQLGPPDQGEEEPTDTASESTHSGPTDTQKDSSLPDGPKDPTFDVAWGSDSVVIRIIDAKPQARFHIGLAQTDQCAEGCWTGEDCLYGLGEWAWCHPSDFEGVTLAYGADPNTLVEGEQTVFTHPNFTYVTTFMVTRERDGACWVFGQDPSYYAAAGCTVL